MKVKLFELEDLLQLRLEEKPELVIPVQLAVTVEGIVKIKTLEAALKEWGGLNDTVSVVAAFTIVLPTDAAKPVIVPTDGVYVTPEVTWAT